MSASHTGWSVAPPSVGASGPDGDFSSRPSDGSSGPGWDPSAPLRPPAGAPAVLTAAPSGEGRLPQSAGMAWGRGATIAGMGNTVNAGKSYLWDKIFMCNTVGTPYNTAPYITGSNIARLGHGSQNS